MAGETGQRLKVAAVGIGGAHTHQDHKDGDEGGSAQQDQTRRPVDREHGHQNDHRNKDGDGHLRQIAGEEILHVFNLFQQQAGPATGRTALDIGRAEATQASEHQLADGLAHRAARLETGHFAAVGQRRFAKRHQQQGNKERDGLLRR